MISDPLNTRIQNVHAGATAITQEAQTFDTLAFGPGSKTSRQITALDNQAKISQIKCSIEHSTTKAGRRRSVLRFDSSVSPEKSVDAGSHTASAYLVIDQEDIPNVDNTTVVDAAVSVLIHSVVLTKASNAVFVVQTALTDFLGGEP